MGDDQKQHDEASEPSSDCIACAVHGAEYNTNIKQLRLLSVRFFNCREFRDLWCGDRLLQRICRCK